MSNNIELKLTNLMQELKNDGNRAGNTVLREAIKSMQWKSVKNFPLVKAIKNDGHWPELKIIEDNFKIMAVLVTMSKYSGHMPGETFWQYHIARIDDVGDLIGMNGYELSVNYTEVTHWKELPEEPYKLEQ